MDLNKAMIIGRLTRDPEARTTSQGTTVCSFGVATNFIWTDHQGQKQEKVEYHNIVAWRKLAEICSQYLRKGSKVYIEGRLQTRDWEGQDGVRRQRTEIVADNMIMLDSKGASFSRGAQSSQREMSGPKEEKVPTISVEEPAKAVASSNKPAGAKKDEVSVEDIPF
jgi:single-strand DNA-binding protein